MKNIIVLRHGIFSKLQKERDEAVKKQKEETNLLKDKTLLLSKEVKAKEL